jgi:hypothetical protein
MNNQFSITHNTVVNPGIIRIIMPWFREVPADMAKAQSGRKTAKNPLDTFSQKRRPGRPPKVSSSSIAGHAYNNRGILQNIWNRLWPALSEAQTESEVVKAFQDAAPGESNFSPYAQLILTVLKDPNFPKRQKARVNFLADSIAGLGLVTPRRSRDICAEERGKAKRKHHIIRYEYYVECSCGYTGNSQDHTCPNCGAAISFPIGQAGLV